MQPYNLSNYSALIKNAKLEGYEFITFDSKILSNNISGNINRSNGLILLRHDIDADLVAAVKMASLEAKLGIKSTYFLMLRSPCYNLMSRSGQKLACQLIQYGHQIGLHYDQGHDEQLAIQYDETLDLIQKQASWIEDILSCKIKTVSFHQPSKRILKDGIFCGDLLNTYDKKLSKIFNYFSDSNRVFPLWRHLNCNSSQDDFQNVLSENYPLNIQLLIHPMWWVYDNLKTEEVWNQAILSNLEQMQTQLLNNEGAYGKRRVFSINFE